MKNLIFALTILIVTSTYGQVGEKNFIDQNFIEVVGKSEMELIPDEIYLKIEINEKDIKGKTLVEIEKSLIDKLEEVGINTNENLVIKDLVSNFRIYFLIKADIVLYKVYYINTHIYCIFA